MTPTKILVVEDNSTTRRMVTQALQRNGHSVFEAPDGKTARMLMQREHPRIVLQDLMLPDADGFELVGQLRILAEGSDVSILAFSGFVSELDDARVSSVGFDDIIAKPIAPSRLVSLIEAHIPVPLPKGKQIGTGRRLILADDDPLQLKLVSFRLTRLGFEVEAVPDGASALEAARRQRPDVLVSDVMMPELDGFGLAMAVRQDPDLNRIPVLLVTSSYVEPADRELARRAGANDLLPRTPELAELLEALGSTLSTATEQAPTVPSHELEELEKEHNRRVFRQLERQVLLNAGLAKRCSSLASELTVLNGISVAVLKHRDVDSALDEALAACFDAGGIAVGALYTIGDDATVSVRSIGTAHALASKEELATLFGHEEVLRAVIRDGKTVYMPSDGVAEPVSRALLERTHGAAILLVPLLDVDKPLGALLMVSRGRNLGEADWTSFARGVSTQIAHVLTLARAYSEREAAERRALEHAALLDAMFTSAPDHVLHIELDGTIRFINRDVRGIAASQWVGTNLWTLFTGQYQIALKDAIDRMIATSEPQGFEAPARQPDGSTAWFSTRIGPVKDQGKVTGAVIVARDVSDKKQAELHLMVADRMASVGTLAAGVAHEINNPLASVIANLDMAMQDIASIAGRVDLPPDLADELADARSAADRVREIVRDLNIFSRAEEERQGPVDVIHVLESTIRMAWNELRHRAKLIKNFEKVPLVEANESRLGQVFLNLLINAIHAIPMGSYESNRITISTSVDLQGRVVVSISDTGSGITEEVRARLFTPYFTTKPVGVGTGLGLAISHRIITQVGGSIDLDSEVGKGTTFRVTLPLSSGPAPDRPSQRIPLPPPVRRGTVLVIDDEEVLAAAIKRYLTSDHEVTTVHRASAALELIEGGARYDVILCDLMMPQITGMELHDMLAERFPDQAQKMVFLTGGAFNTPARDFLATTANKCLEKPFDLKELKKLVNAFVR
ncbi:MAG: response regulator [Deltaproteobacteria bacterium]|nr:response regulator [Deltaproteobacteria bacterium]